AQRIGEIAFAAIALVAKPRAFRTPIEFFRLPLIGAPAAEAECLKAHRFQGDIAGENVEIGPGKFVAVFLLDRPQQSARLVQICVVGPRIERRETLLTPTSAAAPVGDAIGARTVPSEPDEQAAIMAE